MQAPLIVMTAPFLGNHSGFQWKGPQAARPVCFTELPLLPRRLCWPLAVPFADSSLFSASTWSIKTPTITVREITLMLPHAHSDVIHT